MKTFSWPIPYIFRKIQAKKRRQCRHHLYKYYFDFLPLAVGGCQCHYRSNKYYFGFQPLFAGDFQYLCRYGQ